MLRSGELGEDGGERLLRRSQPGEGGEQKSAQADHLELVAVAPERGPLGEMPQDHRHRGRCRRRPDAAEGFEVPPHLAIVGGAVAAGEGFGEGRRRGSGPEEERQRRQDDQDPQPPASAY